jgi:hypothetical protein
MCNGWVGGLRVFVSVRPVQGAFNGGLVSRWVRMGAGLKARPWQSGDPRLSAERFLQQAPDQLAFPISSPPSIRSREAQEAQAGSTVPSMEKRSLSSRSLFLVDVVGCQIGSSGLSPANHRNGRVGVEVRQQALRADSAERLQQRGQGQLVWWYGWSPLLVCRPRNSQT